MHLTSEVLSTLLLVLLSGALGAQVGRTAADGSSPAVVQEEHQDSRFIIVTVSPDPCTTTSTANPAGTCYKPADCTSRGGTGAGVCALGFGTCCYFVRTCGGTTAGATTTFVEPTTGTRALNCGLTVQLLNSNICQLRIDFREFDLEPPTREGQCATDSMTVTGTGNDAVVPTLCGTNTGQHMYVDVNPALGNPRININTASTSFTRNWDMSIKQIACNSADRAPASCTQYFTAATGTVRSFNYVKPTRAQISGDSAQVHLNNQNYRVCVASSAGTSIRWTPTAAADLYAFMMSGDAGSNVDVVGNAEEASFIGTGCPTDYVLISGGTFQLDGAAQSADRYCGLAFPTQVTSNLRPFGLSVVTDGGEVANEDQGNVGFSLDYRVPS